MSENPFHETYRPYSDYYEGGGPRPHGILRTVLIWAAVAVAAILLFGTAVWAVGLLFHLAELLLKVALVTAVVALVWRRITRRQHRNYDA